MSRFPKRLSFALVLAGVGLCAPGAVRAQSTQQVRQQQRLLNTLLGRNQLFINGIRNAEATRDALESQLPGNTPAQERRLENRINQLNRRIAVQSPQLIARLQRIDVVEDRLEGFSPSNPVIASQLAKYLVSIHDIFFSQINQASFVLGIPPASIVGEGTAADPFALRRTVTPSVATSPMAAHQAAVAAKHAAAVAKHAQAVELRREHR